MVAAGRSKSLTTGNVRRGVAAVHEALGSLALETPVNCHSELMEDLLRNIEPVQLGVEQMCQASVELPSITDDTGCIHLHDGKASWLLTSIWPQLCAFAKYILLTVIPVL